ELYAYLLWLKGLGFPLWCPSPSPILILLVVCETNGIRIGDVGIIHSTGYFDFLFNICLPADHPFN
ncbi:hypothetical protein BDQ17DRAFT_1224115, partial [Cyathus striatus]